MKTRTSATAALALAVALTLAGCSGTGSSTGVTSVNEQGASPTPSAQAADFNGADVMFEQMMIPHHQQAVEMADLILAKDGVDDRVVTLAENIKAAQQPEIDQLEAWLNVWGADADAMGGMDHGDGMMSDDDMAALEAATGAEASRLFLTQMIVHHEGAIAMARAEVQDGENSGAVDMAQGIADSQTVEVAEMQDLIDQL
ncbi:DUF305 domain-containing protein [Microbacterium sp.]|uniref:DUF305 domain-containing protein n=1 Tax=Microbacterium sp. TaxID=51671 RepID=UPI003A8ADD93